MFLKKLLNISEISKLSHDFLGIRLLLAYNSYKENKEYFVSLKVVKCVTECFVALVNEYNQCLVKNEGAILIFIEDC